MPEFRVEAQENVRYARPINLIVEAENEVEAFITAADHLNRRGYIVNVCVVKYHRPTDVLHVHSSAGTILFTDPAAIARVQEAFGKDARGQTYVSGSMFIYKISPYSVPVTGRVLEAH